MVRNPSATCSCFRDPCVLSLDEDKIPFLRGLGERYGEQLVERNRKKNLSAFQRQEECYCYVLPDPYDRGIKGDSSVEKRTRRVCLRVVCLHRKL